MSFAQFPTSNIIYLLRNKELVLGLEAELGLNVLNVGLTQRSTVNLLLALVLGTVTDGGAI